MVSRWLFPHSYRLAGWFLFIPSLVLGLAVRYAEFRLVFLDVTFRKPKEDSGFLDKLIWGLTDGGFFPFNGEYSSINLTDEVAALGMIGGLLLIAFSKEKVEDEMISQLRLESLQWAVYANYLVLAVLLILLHGGLFLDVMIYNMFTVLLVFIIRFRLSIRRNERTVLMAV
ncbi:hypothetical protein GCM10027347_44000 [Larkinella harenae]